MKRLASIFFIALFGMTLAHAAGNPEAGKAKSATCAGCHGADGNSTVPSFPKLAGQNERYLIKQLQDMKTGDRVVNEMLAFLPALTDQDIEDIAAYYAGQSGTVGQADPELVELGRKLYMGGNPETGVTACAACHSPSGKGNPAAGFPSLSGQHTAYTAAQLNKFRLGARHEGAATADVRINDGEARMMRETAFRLKDFEIEALASYIAGLH